MGIRRVAKAFAAAACCAAGLAACGGDDDNDSPAGATSGGGASTSTSASTSTGKLDPSKPEVHVALISLKIPGSDLLGPYEIGANAAADSINAAGGIGGRKLVIDSCNSQNQAALAATCARRLSGMKPVAFIGCDTALTTSGLPVFQRDRTPGLWCLNSPAEFKDPLLFGIEAGGPGQQIAMARQLCTRPDVKTVSIQNQDLPQLHSYEPPVRGILEGCGKKVKYVYVAPTAADFTPTLNQLLSAKPDFIMTFPLSGPQTIQYFKAFNQAGFPASKMFTMSSSLDYDTMLKPAGPAMDGVTMMLPNGNPVDPANPDVAAYKKAVEARNGSFGPFNANVQRAYAYVYTIYTAAKETGFDTFDSAALVKFLGTANGVNLPMNRALVNPGSAQQPQIKQPYMQMVQWKGGELVTVTEGTENGWVKATL
jgi:ABC-type branched-subunit amino acid transport system substrate-binding protein